MSIVYLKISDAGDANANGTYPDSKTVDNIQGYPIYRKNDGYYVKYDGFRSDPSGGGFATIQWGLFNPSDQPIYFAESVPANDPSTIRWFAAGPDNIPPFAPPPAPTVQLIIYMSRTGRNKSDNECLNDISYNSSISGGEVPFQIPAYDYASFTYVSGGASNDDNIATQVFKTGGSGGTTVATLTYTYWGNTNNVETITKS